MNKLRYRIVFNKARGLQMVVAEHVSAGGKAASSVASSPPALVPPSLRLCALATAVAFALCGTSARAQIVADPGVPGGQRPTVLNTANGVIQVNIQTPSAAGVSRNTYKQFDVPNSGAVLNNARTDTRTQLGGWVQGNPWLAQREAKVILNEVNSSNPSRLQGYIEVAGPRADVIIANPAGISVDGGGFINVSRATLTTGTARMTDGHIDGFTLARGRVSIDGAGLDASSTDYTAIIARSVAVNAALWAQQLRVTTGTGEVAIGGDNMQTSPGTARGETPNYAIDVSALGGMYANKIFLLGTEAGVGVRNAGTIGAAVGELIVTSDGRLENSGTLAGDGGMRVTAGALKNSGVVQSASEATLAIQGDLDNNGGTIRAQRVDLRSVNGTLSNRDGHIEQTGGAGLDMRAAALTNTGGGQIGAAAPAALPSAAGPAIAPSVSAPDASAVASTAGNNPPATSAAPPMAVANGVIQAAQAIDNSSGRITAGGAISLATNAIDNSGGKLYLPELMLRGASFDNRGGTVDIVRNFSVAAPAFDNTGGTILAGAATIDIAGNLNNTQGSIDSGSGLFVKAGAIDNSAGVLRAAGNVDTAVAGEFVNQHGAIISSGDSRVDAGHVVNDGGNISAAGALTVRANELSNRAGAAQATGGIDLAVGGALANQNGTIRTGAMLRLGAASLNNSSGVIESASTMQVHASQIDNVDGHIVNAGEGDTDIVAETGLTNSGLIGGNGNLSLRSEALDNRRGGVVTAGRSLTLVGQHLGNEGTIDSGAQLTVTAARLDNRGEFRAADAAHINAGIVRNDGGRIAAGTDATLTAGALSNRSGAILSHAGALALDVADTLDNADGSIETRTASGKLTVQAGAILNGSGRIVSAADGTLASKGALQAGGLIQAAGTLGIAAQTVEVTDAGKLVSGSDMRIHAASRFENAGEIGSQGALALEASGAIVNNRGNMVASGPLDVLATTLNNNGGQIVTFQGAVTDLTVRANSISNAGGRIANTGSGATKVESATTLANGGLIAGNGKVSIGASALVNDAGGKISAIGALDLTATTRLQNAGAIAAGGNMALTAANLDNDSGTIASDAALALHAQALSNHSGSIAALGDAAIVIAGAADNSNGSLRTAGDLRLELGAALVNNTGAIESVGEHGAMLLHAGSIDNLAGRIVNGGSGATSVVATTAFVNSGVVAGNGGLSMAAATLENRAGGAITAGDALTLSTVSRLDNAGTIASRGTFDLLASAANVTNSGQLVAGGHATITAGALNNDGGQIATSSGSAADLEVLADSFSNRNGSVLSARDASVTSLNHLINQGGTIQAANALRVFAGSALDNHSGIIEDGGASATMSVAAQSIDNTLGRIVNAGTGLTEVRSAAGIDNNGTIAGSGALALAGTSLQNGSGGTISSGADLALAFSQQFANLGGAVSSAGTLTFNQAGATFRNSGTIVGQTGVSIVAGAIDNAGGQLVTVKNGGGNLLLRGDSFANHGGVLVADGNVDVAIAGLADNADGILQGAHDVQVTAGAALLNGGGTIEAAGASGNLTVGAGSIDNGTGRINNAGTGSSVIASQGRLTNNGLVAASGNLTVQAAALQNGPTGTVGASGNLDLAVTGQVDNAGLFSSGGALHFNQAGAVFNNSGTTVSGAGTTLIAAAINNHGQVSTVRGGGGDLFLSGVLNNTGGRLLADGNATLLLNGTFDNASGTVQAVKDLWVATNGAVHNQGGAIETLGAGSALTLHADEVDNTAGNIVNIGNRETRITANGGIANGGTIGGNGDVVFAGQTLSNLASGSISSGANLDLAIARDMANHGVINSAGTLTFNQAGAAFRNSNQVSAGDTIHIVAGEFNNEGGRIGTGAGSGASTILQAQTVNNAGGHVVSDRDLSLSADLLLGGGEFSSGRDLAVSLQGDYVNNAGAAQLHAQRDLSLAVTGNLRNAATLEAVRALTLSANQVDNLAGATIQAQDVTIRTVGNMANGGEINGATALDIHAGGTLDNAHGIVGGNVALTAQNLNNTGSLALLGSTSNMALNVADVLNNTGNATIYSAAGLGASAATLNNLGSTVEAAGDLMLVADTINNIRENVSIVEVKTLDETRHMTLPSWYTHGDNNNEYDPKSALYRPQEAYFVNPADILEDKEVVTPDGYMIHRVVFRTHANDSAFFAAGSGAYGKYGHQERIATTEGTRVLYYLERADNMANPDQGGATGNGNPLFNSATMVWDGPAVSFSSDYGSCSTDCVRFVTLPGYDDPVNTINQTTIRELAPSKDRLEIYRDAHYTAVEDRLADGAGTQARILSGGDMQIVAGRLHNQYGQVMANGFLDLSRAEAVVNEGATLYRRYNFDGTWTTENRTVTPYTMPTLSEAIGTTKGVIDGRLGVSIDARNFSNIDVTAGTAGTVRDAIQVLGSGTGNGTIASVGTNATAAGSDAGLSGGAAGTIGQAAATGGLVSTHWIASTGGAEQIQGNNGAIVTAALASASSDNGGTTGPRSALNAGSVVSGVYPGTQGAGGTANATSQQGSVMKVAPSGLFTQNSAASGKYLFETRPQFANQKDWASSDYLLSALGMDGSLMQKRLGDGFYEQRLVREQIAELTGRGADNGVSDDARYQELLRNAVTVAKQFGLRPGITLTAEQVSRLTSDIVWLESQSVSLPDGKVETVLVPKVYLAHLGQDTIRSGALVTGANVYINTQEDIVNRGGVIDSGKGRTILISSRDIVNEGGTIRGGDVLAAAARDVRNESTSGAQVYGSAQTNGSYIVLASQASIAASGTLAIQAGRDVSDVAGKISAANASITAGRDINFNALATGSTYRATVGQDKQDNSTITHALSQVATTGTLAMSAGRDLSLSGTQVAIGTDGAFLAGRALTVGSVMNEVKTDEHNDASSKHYEKRAQDNQTVVGSSIGGGGVLQLTAGINETAALTVSSSAVSSTGALSLGASGDVVIGGVQERHVLDNASHHESSGLLKSKSTTTKDYSATNTLIGSNVSGGNVLVNSGHDIRITGSGIVADGDVNLIAKNSVAITAGVSNSTESHHSEVKESGFLSGGGFGISYGTRKTTTDQQQDATLQSGQSRSMVGSLDGNLNIRAGERIDIAGSDVSAGNDITMLAKAISITPGLDQIDGKFSRKFTQDGLTLSIGGGAINAVQTVQAMGSAAAQTGNTRMKALAAATAAKAVSGTISDIARNGISASVSLTAGHTESEQTQTTASRAHFGSNVSAGNNLTIVATGGGEQSNIDVVGSDLSAKHTIVLAADNKVNLLAAQDLDSQHSQTSSKSAALGVAAGFSSKGGMSFGLTASASAGRGTDDAEGVTQINSHIRAGEKVLISSGGDLNLKGAVVEGARVIANVGGDLNIESLQDKAKFDSKNQSIGVSATVGFGTNFSGGVNAGTIRSDYASVQEQSGLRAGNGGFQINVAGNTDLKGGVISSTAAGSALSSLVTGTLTHSDILNYSKVNAAALGIGGSAAIGGLGFSGSGTNLVRFEKPGATSGITGAAAMSTAQTGVTRSAIGAGTILIKNEAAQIALTGSDAAKSIGEISREVNTGVDTSGRVANKFDLDSARATLTIASNFSSMAARTVGDYATTKLNEASNLKALAASETDPIKRVQLFEQADSLQETWKEGGAGRVALHATVGGLTGGMDGALGAGATALSTPLIASRIDRLDVPASVKSALLLSAGATVGAVAGGEAGALASLNEIDNNYLSHKRPAGFNKRSEQEQFEKARDSCTAGDKAACNERDRWIAISTGRDQVITNVCASGSSSECHDVIAQAIDSGNKVIFDSKKQAVVYKIGSPEIGNAPKVGQGSFHEQLSLSFRDALEGEVLGGVGKWVLGAAGRALGLSSTNVAAEIAEIKIAKAWPGAAESAEDLTIAANRAGSAIYAVKPASGYTMADEIGNMVGARNALVTSESNALQRIAANNSVDTGSAARIARIDEISKANWARRIDEMINSQDYVFRYLTQDGFNASIKYNSVRGFTSTNFSPSSAEIMSGAQIFEQWPGALYTGPVKYGVAIPVSKLNGFSVARPMGGAAASGWEVFANSYPKAGAGHFTQFLINPVPLNDVFIFTLKP